MKKEEVGKLGGIFNLEGPLMRGLTKVFDLMVLNFLVIICCIPIITIGPAITGLYYVTMKMTDDRDSYIVKSFLKSFRQNFIQAVILGVIVTIVGFIAIMNYFIMFQHGSAFPTILAVIIVAIEIFFTAPMLYIFPLLARFENSCGALLKNAILLSIIHFPTTILLAIIYLSPFILMLVIPGKVFMGLLPFWIIFGFSVPAYVSSNFLNKIFKKLEEKSLEEKSLEEKSLEEKSTIETEEIEVEIVKQK